MSAWARDSLRLRQVLSNLISNGVVVFEYHDF